MSEHHPPGCAGVPARGPLTHHFARFSGFAGEEPVAELGIVTVRVEQGVRPIRLDQFRRGDLLFPPALVGLAGELQDPQGHRDGDPVSGELAHERVEPCDGRFACER